MGIYSFEQILAQNLSRNAARIKFPARFLVALFQVQTVNLAKIARVFAGSAKIASHYKRLQRFLRFFSLSRVEIARLVLRLLKIEPSYTIAIDRTEWQSGKQWSMF